MADAPFSMPQLNRALTQIDANFKVITGDLKILNKEIAALQKKLIALENKRKIGDTKQIPTVNAADIIVSEADEYNETRRKAMPSGSDYWTPARLAAKTNRARMKAAANLEANRKGAAKTRERKVEVRKNREDAVERWKD
jgi:hypothetical protein